MGSKRADGTKAVTTFNHRPNPQGRVTVTVPSSIDNLETGLSNSMLLERPGTLLVPCVVHAAACLTRLMLVLMGKWWWVRDGIAGSRLPWTRH